MKKQKELSERTKAEMARGRKVLKEKFAVETFGRMLEEKLPKDLKGWKIGDRTYIAPDERFKVYVHIYPAEGELIEIIEDEDDFPSEQLVGQLMLLLY